ncbi:A/G-specific adenine glycosylase [Zavarzinia sp. CC-PAN008]|uniref:A/G-specific adenine glycosylase n=1 Tax=Zavarzinia sp. CC-PAN008 TaxID=3243332 RepID=UPI003F748196
MMVKAAAPGEAGPPSECDPDRSLPDVRADLLAWYDTARRRLPWRADPGVAADPYRVWLSEIMLQQTTVAAVAPYFARFLARWPDVGALAAAPQEEVLREWAGLGYYARARNLHACAQAVAAGGGRFPADVAALRALPGVGAYTAGAIAAIAFGIEAGAVDGNVERVLARVLAVDQPPAETRRRVTQAAAALARGPRPGDLLQAMMDLGATLCTPRSPACALCPVRPHCAGFRAGLAADLPRKAARAPKPTRRGIVYWLRDGMDRVLLRRRPPKGLLGGMPELPGGEWVVGEPAEMPPLAADWRAVPGAVRHVFTHFSLELEVRRARLRFALAPRGTYWVPIAEIDQAGLPALMAKAAAHALRAGG